MISLSSTKAIKPPSNASGVIWPTTNPCVPPLNLPSVINATVLPKTCANNGSMLASAFRACPVHLLGRYILSPPHHLHALYRFECLRSNLFRLQILLQSFKTLAFFTADFCNTSAFGKIAI